MKKVFFLYVIIFFIISCSGQKKINQDPLYEDFFLKTRIIMTKLEAQIYKHLPDQKAREQFVVDFWAKRDPTPETEINENREEFESRIEYANRWFNEGKGGRTRGWDSLRGRIFILLGHPERREMGEWTPRNRLGGLLSTKRTPLEMWYYHYHQLRLVFTGDEFGKFKLQRIPATLGTALERVKYTLDFAGAVSTKHKLKFSANFKNNNITLKIPVDKISFEVGKEKVKAEFEVKVFVHLGYKKIKTLTKKIKLEKYKKDILNQKHVKFSLPFAPQKKGRYFLDVIVMEKSTSFRYRNYVKFKY